MSCWLWLLDLSGEDTLAGAEVALGQVSSWFLTGDAKRAPRKG